MKSRPLAIVAILGGLVAVVMLRSSGPDAPVEPPESEGRRPARPATATSVAPPPGAEWPERDPFRYAEPRERPRPVPAETPRPAASVTAPPPAPSPLRLIGLVRKGGALKAALSLWGETVILGAGEESRGYRVISIDEEAGVKVRGPDGVELALVPTSS